MDNWISVEKDLPSEGEAVDIWCENTGRHTNYRYRRDYLGMSGNNFFEPIKSGRCCIRTRHQWDRATHWMHLPEAPKD